MKEGHIDIAEFNRRMISVLMQKQEAMSDEMKYLRKQFSFMRHAVEEMVKEKNENK